MPIKEATLADVLHSSLTGADLHESKGAASASIGQVAIANGAGSAPFGNLSYSYLTNTPVTPTQYFNATAVTGSPKILNYIVTAVAGSWSQAITGISTLHAVQATVVSGTSGASSAFHATLNTATTATITGQVVSSNGSGLGTTQTVYLTVFGV